MIVFASSFYFKKGFEFLICFVFEYLFPKSLFSVCLFTRNQPFSALLNHTPHKRYSKNISQIIKSRHALISDHSVLYPSLVNSPSLYHFEDSKKLIELLYHNCLCTFNQISLFVHVGIASHTLQY